jgi:serine/threonine protein kinase
MDANAQTPELVGSVLGGRYKIIRLMGAGGMGAVYEAIQEDLNRRVAVKVLLSHLALDPDLVGRFKREAQAAAALGHPNIVHVTDFQVNAGEPPFLVMEYLTGKSFRQLMNEEKRLAPKRAAFIATQVLSALAAAHDAKIVHRDIKPDNIFLSSTSAMNDLVKVLDFGIAKLLRETEEGPLTMAGTVLGTLSYMAPEQARGDVVDGRADLYAVGACMYYAISGRRPLEAPDRNDLQAAIQATEPQPLALVCPEIDPRLGKIVDRALRKDPSDRFPTAQEMAEAIATWLKPAPSTPALPVQPAASAPATVVTSPSEAMTAIEGPPAPSLSPETQVASPQARPTSDPPRARPPQPRTMLSAQAAVVPARQVTVPLAQVIASARPVSQPHPARSLRTPRKNAPASIPWLWVILAVGGLLFAATAVALGLYFDRPAAPKAEGTDVPTAAATASAVPPAAAVSAPPAAHHATTVVAAPATASTLGASPPPPPRIQKIQR